MTLEGKVTSNNATSIDEKDNSYTWDISDVLENGIELTYDTSKSTNSNIALYLIIAGIVSGLAITAVIIKKVIKK
jgi:hypothetical protein